MSTLKREVARVYRPLLHPARYKGAYGGRGSGKSHFFAEQIVVESIANPGLRSVCIREVQKTLAQSAKRLIEDKIAALNVGHLFDIYIDRIETPGGGLITFAGMQDHTAESIKSLEGVGRAWIEEAQTLSSRSLALLRPTIRAESSEIWASWNPTRKTDAIDVFLRGEDLPGAIVVKANWRDNPWFPGVLEDERKLDLERYPDRYDHIWEGGYAKVLEGAYYARQLSEAAAQGRIGSVSADPLLPVRAFFDLGGAGANADAMVIWIAQWIDREIRVLDYMEGVGQPLAYYTAMLRKRGWGEAICILPHDGVNTNNITGKRYEDHLRDAGFKVPPPVKNQGKGAATMRVEAARRLFPRIWFNETTTGSGREALGWYHEKMDEARGIGLGPDHDWSSHAADAFGLMCVAYEEPRKTTQKIKMPNLGIV